jgi:Fe-S oxidoreductase
MAYVVIIVSFLCGFAWGRAYGWMKYHYPEFQEEIALRIARKKAERARYEAEADRYRGMIDDDLDRRLNN